MEYVHHCFFCGWHRSAESATILEPACERCGGVLRATTPAELERLRREEALVAAGARHRRRDGTGLFGALVSLPWLLALLGVRVDDVIFGAPLVMLLFAVRWTLAAARREPRFRSFWRWVTAGCVLGAASCVLAVVSKVLTGSEGRLAFYVGALASLTLLAAALTLARTTLARGRLERLVDAGLICLVTVSVVVYGCIVPGLDRGNVALTLVVAVDLVALIAVTLSAVGRGPLRRRPADWWLVFGMAAATAGDASVSMAASGQIPGGSAPTSILWALAAYAVAAAAHRGLEVDTDERPEPSSDWLVGRLVLPLAAVLALPALAVSLSAAGALAPWGGPYFGACFVVALVLAFGRQAWLLVERQRTVAREQRLRREATRRNAELKALTGLATTMTQTLEEAPITEQALGVMHTAARATSAALHLRREDGARRLVAVAGEWQAEGVWAALTDDNGSPVVHRRGGRSVLRLPLCARGARLGAVTLMRPESKPFTDNDVDLLRLLVDQMGVAIQNARDYREKLEQAIRDPLTDLYNRRFLTEALAKEVERAGRYGDEVALVIFDVDDFKAVNDRHGHQAGDEVLRRIAAIGDELIRPIDSFARLGGEEFALLLPHTSQFQALLVAERIRTAIARTKLLDDRRVTVSGGVAACPLDASTAEDLQRRADAALYWAKRHGKDLCAVASDVRPDETDESASHAHLYALVAMVDAQQLHTRDHSENVAAYAMAIGHALGWERERLTRLRRGALLHDIGKAAVRPELLAKPAALTPEERVEIETHAEAGATMLEHAGLAEEARWVRHHHERLDGAGYPDGLAGERIPLEARVLFVADSFEAMTSDRPYRAGMPVADALAELRRCAGSQFDPELVELFCGLVEEGRIPILALRSAA